MWNFNEGGMGARSICMVLGQTKHAATSSEEVLTESSRHKMMLNKVVWTKWSEQSGLNMQRRGLWGLVVVWLSWLSGRALAAQARCPGFDSWQLPAFSLSSILPQILFNSLMGLTFKYNDDIPHMHASRGIYQSASQSCKYQKMTQTDNVNLVHVYLKLYDNLCSKGIWSLWVVPIPRQQNLGMS